jgi:ApaG protein
MCPLAAYASTATTNGVNVVVRSRFLPEQSRPASKQYRFAYAVRILNNGAHPVQLLSRHWIITDANGKTTEVVGPGVVGEQPILAPGAHFEYVSSAMLEVPSAEMRGTYRMLGPNGQTFDAVIAPFTLALPYSLH